MATILANPAVINASLQVAALVITTIQQYSQGQITAEQMQAQWQQAINRVRQANQAWEAAAGQSQPPP